MPAMTAPPLVELRDVRKSFDANHVLRGISLALRKGTTLAVIPMFAAFEAHVINVTARIENALSVNTDPISFGTVFPQEELDRLIRLSLSKSFED